MFLTSENKIRPLKKKKKECADPAEGFGGGGGVLFCLFNFSQGKDFPVSPRDWQL